MSAANRHTVREAIMMSVFELNFCGKSFTELKIIFPKNMAEFNLTEFDQEFAEKLIAAVQKNSAKIHTIVKRLAPNFPFTKIAWLDQAVLLVGLAELNFLPEMKIPASVTLDEYVEIAKQYGGDGSRRFVNGVLSSSFKKQKQTL